MGVPNTMPTGGRPRPARARKSNGWTPASTLTASEAVDIFQHRALGAKPGASIRPIELRAASIMGIWPIAAHTHTPKVREEGQALSTHRASAGRACRQEGAAQRPILRSQSRRAAAALDLAAAVRRGLQTPPPPLAAPTASAHTSAHFEPTPSSLAHSQSEPRPKSAQIHRQGPTWGAFGGPAADPGDVCVWGESLSLSLSGMVEHGRSTVLRARICTKNHSRKKGSIFHTDFGRPGQTHRIGHVGYMAKVGAEQIAPRPDLTLATGKFAT